MEITAIVVLITFAMATFWECSALRTKNTDSRRMIGDWFWGKLERATGAGLHRSVARASSSACDVMNTIGIQISLLEVMLKSQSVHSWHPYIQNQAIRLMQRLELRNSSAEEKLLARKPRDSLRLAYFKLATRSPTMHF